MCEAPGVIEECFEDRPRIIRGGVAVDDRGTVTFCNDFDMTKIVRCYMLENHEQGYVRAWHGHAVEAKYVMVLSGVAIVGAVEMIIGAFDGPYIDGRCSAERFTLHSNGDVLYIPPGYANGHKNLITGTRVMHFSTMTLAETQGDDYRFDSDIHGWVWDVKER